MATPKKENPQPGGRPTDYNEEISAKICEMLAMGDSLRTVCKGDDMPAMSTVFLWLRRYPEFMQQYEKAKQEAADAMAEDLLDIADNGTNDWLEIHGEGGETVGWRQNGEAMQRSRLRCDVRKFLMAKMKPKKYGDNANFTVRDPNGSPMFIVDLGSDKESA